MRSLYSCSFYDWYSSFIVMVLYVKRRRCRRKSCKMTDAATTSTFLRQSAFQSFQPKNYDSGEKLKSRHNRFFTMIIDTEILQKKYLITFCNDYTATTC